MNRFEPAGQRGAPLKLLLFACALVALTAFVAPATRAVPDDVCANCHDEVVEAFSSTAHGHYFSGQGDSWRGTCESCHGSATAHVESGGDPDLIMNPAKSDELSSSQTCLSCHRSHRFDDWSFSAHNNAGVNCASCHNVHQPAAESKRPTEELCYTCHSNVRAASHMPSRHPIGEGLLSCKDCHGVHGEKVALTMDGSSRELCFTCHADKEGPFVYEHAPVMEDCMICHTPHGSVANNLLKQNEPALCLGCHSMHFHATVESADGAFGTPMAPERAGVSDRDSFKRGMTTKCTECHTEIHGSDLPSQAISTGGNALTR